MNGKQCKVLRGRNRGSRVAYRQAKRAYTLAPTLKAQQPKPSAVRQRKHPQPIEPTWPRTEDQQHQSRPAIVMRKALPGYARKTGERVR